VCLDLANSQDRADKCDLAKSQDRADKCANLRFRWEFPQIPARTGTN
jgi:hypothetical protein